MCWYFLHYIDPLHHSCTLFLRKTIFDGLPADPNYQPFPEDRPGGFHWGEREEVAAEMDDE